MTTVRNAAVSGGAGWIFASGNKFLPQIALDSEDGTGSGGAGDDDAAAKAAADKAAAEEAAKKAKEKEGDGEGGKKKPTDAEAKLLKESMERKQKLDAANAELAALKTKLEAFEGIDPVKVKEILAAQSEAEKKALEAKGDFDTLKKRMADEHKSELEKALSAKTESDKKLAAAMAEIDDLTIGSQFLNSAFVKDELVMPPAKARKVYGDYVERVNGQIVVYDKPKGHEKRAVYVNSSGDPLSFDEAMKRLIETDPDRESLVRSKMQPGAGSKTTEQKPKQQTSGLAGLSRIQASLLELSKAK